MSSLSQPPQNDEQQQAAAAQEASAQAQPQKSKAKHLVVDTGAIINGTNLQKYGTTFYTIKDVLDEVRDKKAQERLQMLQFDLQLKEPSQEAYTLVSNFAKKTGDYPFLSVVDLKVMALACMLEQQENGMKNIRTEPKPKLQTVRPPTITPQEEEELEMTGEGQVDIEQAGACSQSTTTTTTTDEQTESTTQENDDDGWTTVPTRASKSLSAALSQRDLAVPGFVSGDNDDDGWITPANLSDVAKKSRGGDEEISSLDVDVACITTDFTMQNVLLQMGITVSTVDGLVVTTVKQWALKCHGCFKITKDTSKKFCPSCGNNTLMRVSMWVKPDGTLTYSKGIKNFNLRGTRYSIPQPTGGRINNDIILCEDEYVRVQRLNRGKKQMDMMDPDAPAEFGTSGKGGRKVQVGYGRRNPNAARGRRR